MYKKSIILGTILSLFGGLFINNKEEKITKITYEISGDSFENVRLVKQKMYEDFQKLTMPNIKDTHQNIKEHLEMFSYTEDFRVSYQNYQLKIICSEINRYTFKGYLFQSEESEVIKKTFFFVSN